MANAIDCQEASYMTALPFDTPPPPAFQSSLTSGCTLRVLQGSASNAARQAVVCVNNTSRMARDIWTSDANDEQLAEGVLSALHGLFVQRDAAVESKPTAAASSSISFRVRASETALLNVARRQSTGAKMKGYGQSKTIDAQAARATMQATLFSSHSFASDAEYQEWVHDNAIYDANLFVALGMATDMREEYGREIERITKTLPLGMHTPTHHFRSLLDSDGTLIGRLWFDINTITRTSYCFRLCMQEAFRGKGLGKVLLAVWEQSAAELGAATMMLHVYEQNKPAVRLYTKYGFHTDSYTFEY